MRNKGLVFIRSKTSFPTNLDCFLRIYKQSSFFLVNNTKQISAMNVDFHKVAVLVPNYFTPLSLQEVLCHLSSCDSIDIISSESNKVKSWDKAEDAFHSIELYKNDLNRLSAMDYDSILIHEELVNVPRHAVRQETINFINKFMGRKKPIMVLCQYPWTMVTGNKKNIQGDASLKISA